MHIALSQHILFFVDCCALMATTDVTCEKYLEWTSFFFWWFYICYGDDDENVEDHHELFDEQIYAKLWIFYAFKICHNKNSHDIVKQKCSFTNREIFFYVLDVHTHKTCNKLWIFFKRAQKSGFCGENVNTSSERVWMKIVGVKGKWKREFPLPWGHAMI